MCGRFVQTQRPEVYGEHFSVDVVKTEALAPSWNVAPTDSVYAVAEHDGARMLGTFAWGLVPWWSKDRRGSGRNINARAETAAERPAFRDSFRERRCLIPADGFYEWQVKAKGKLPHYIYRADGAPLALAGLWSSWRDPESGERLRTCTIITGEPNKLVAELHNRMPVILGPESWALWLDPGQQDLEALRSLLTVAPADWLAEHPVSTLVNKVQNNLPDCIVPLASGAVDSD